MPDEAAGKRRKGRSPSYPGISLETAIRRARALYEVEGRNAVPISAIAQNWGYKSPTTGPASVTYAALKKYSLITDEGTGTDRVARLTDLALDILLSPSEQDRARYVREAALAPPIHSELWNQYQSTGLPSDSALHWELVRNRDFTDSGANDFIQEFRETIAFANLSSSRPESDESRETDDNDTHTAPEEQRSSFASHAKVARQRTSERGLSYPVPVALGEDVVIEGQFPITEEKWAQFLTVLEAMKPALVTREPLSDRSTERGSGEGSAASIPPSEPDD